MTQIGLLDDVTGKTCQLSLVLGFGQVDQWQLYVSVHDVTGAWLEPRHLSHYVSPGLGELTVT